MLSADRKVRPGRLEKTVLLGELALDGRVRLVRGGAARSGLESFGAVRISYASAYVWWLSYNSAILSSTRSRGRLHRRAVGIYGRRPTRRSHRAYHGKNLAWAASSVRESVPYPTRTPTG